VRLEKIKQRIRWPWREILPEILWYLVGLIATDGALSIDGRHIKSSGAYEFFLVHENFCNGWNKK